METCRDSRALRARVAEWKRDNLTVALVPTMGNLHAGHLALVERARAAADKVVVSLFVNPLQFGPDEDLAAYPRTLSEDSGKLAASGADLLFAPGVEDMYPEGDAAVVVHTPDLENILCGLSRPGHFAGVATVVAKLFNLATPDVAVFGSKDYQQLVVIRRMAAGLAFPVEIIGAETVREPDGLAMSSRNIYLTTTERAQAPTLYRVLSEMAERLRDGERDFAELEARALQALKMAGFRPDYVAVREPTALGEPSKTDGQYVILGAAWLGRARLIDNIVLVDNSG